MQESAKDLLMGAERVQQLWKRFHPHFQNAKDLPLGTVRFLSKTLRHRKLEVHKSRRRLW